MNCYWLQYNFNEIVCISHKVHIYLEQHRVCPLVGIGTSPTPHPQASVPLSPEPNGGGGTLAWRWGGGGVPIPTTLEKV